MTSRESAGAATDASPADDEIFFYGTLRDRDLLSIVLGRETLDGLSFRSAHAPDAHVSRVKGQTFPMLFAAPGGTAEGMLLSGVTARDLARLSFFEDEDYQLTALTVETEGGAAAARAFLPTERLLDSGEPWRFEQWLAHDKALMLECAREQMSYFGRVAEGRVESWWPDIVARAERRLGLQRSIRSPMRREDVETVWAQTPHDGYFKVEEHRVRARRLDGSGALEVQREVFVSSLAVTVLPYDPRRDEVLLIEQWRAGPWTAGDANPWPVEVVAGRVDPGETPDAVARREAREEAGVALGRIEHFADSYPSPGLLSERVISFVGEADLAGAGGTHGLAHEQEDIRAFTLPFSEAMTALARGDVNTAPTIYSLLWLARNRERLRLDWS